MYPRHHLLICAIVAFAILCCRFGAIVNASAFTRTAQSMATTLADSHSVNHEFEELEIEQDGLFFGSFWGHAELALNDPANGDFVVKHIVLRGDRFTAAPSALRPGRKVRVPGFMALTRPAKDDRTFTGHLFRAIEQAIYADETAAATWANEMEDA